MVKKISVIEKNGLKVLKEIGQKQKRLPDMARDMQASGVGYYLLIPILVGLGAGLFIDNKFATKPFFTIIGLLIGVIGTFYNLFKVKKLTE